MWTALLVVCTLLAHSFDNCAAHLGVATSLSADTPHLTTICPDAASGACEICTPSDKSHSDGCDPLTEIAVLTSSQHQIEHQAVTLAATVAVIPTMPQVIALSGCLDGRAAPPPAAPLAVLLRSSLPSRAPPLSA